MARLTAAQRKKLPASAFAGPNRSYPVQDAGHAKAALGRVAEFGSPALQKKVKAKVHKKYKGIGKKEHSSLVRMVRG